LLGSSSLSFEFSAFSVGVSSDFFDSSEASSTLLEESSVSDASFYSSLDSGLSFKSSVTVLGSGVS